MLFVIQAKVLIWGWSTTGLPPSWTIGYRESWLLKLINETDGLCLLICALPNESLTVTTNVLYVCRCFFVLALFVTCLVLPVTIATVTLSFHSQL